MMDEMRDRVFNNFLVLIDLANDFWFDLICLDSYWFKLKIWVIEAKKKRNFSSFKLKKREI